MSNLQIVSELPIVEFYENPYQDLLERSCQVAAEEFDCYVFDIIGKEAVERAGVLLEYRDKPQPNIFKKVLHSVLGPGSPGAIKEARNQEALNDNMLNPVDVMNENIDEAKDTFVATPKGRLVSIDKSGFDIVQVPDFDPTIFRNRMQLELPKIQAKHAARIAQRSSYPLTLSR